MRTTVVNMDYINDAIRADAERHRKQTTLAALLPYPLVVPVWGVKTVSESNVRCHHMVRHRRFKGQRAQVAAELARHGHILAAVGDEVKNHGGRVTISLTRLGPKRLDTGNVEGAQKAVQDEVAKWLDVDDGHSGLAWSYPQQKGDYGVIVEIRAA